MDAAAAEDLWNRFAAELFRFVRARVPADHEARDIVQTTYLRALQHLASDELPENPRAWLYQISRNLVVDTHRHAARSRALADALAADPDHARDEAEPPNLEERLEQGAFALTAKSLPLFIGALDEPYRSALVATEIEGLTQAEAARRAGISLSGMKSRVQRGRRLLRAALEQCCHFELDPRGRMIAYQKREPSSCC